MPVISMFYGIIIAMYYEGQGHHHAAHIHVRYQGFKSSISIDTGEILAGSFPRKQLKLIQAWIELHKDELLANWDLAKAGNELFKIQPLQ